MMEKARQHFIDLGERVVVSDLYQMQFRAVGSKHDFSQLSKAQYYKYPIEQLYAHQHGHFIPELTKEMNKMAEADLLIFNFPLWWFGMPAILKGWVDRVLAYGFAYGGNYGMHANGRFKDRKAILAVTTGSPQHFYTEKGVHKRSLEEILRNIQEGIFQLVGYQTYDPFIAYSVSRVSAENRQQILLDYTRFLSKIIEDGTV